MRYSKQWALPMLGVLTLIILIDISSGNRAVPFGRVGSGDLGDYRLQNGEPFVTLFEHENFRGKILRQRVRKECSNIPSRYSDTTSSIWNHGRCVTICDNKFCDGNCVNLYPDEKGVKRLNSLGINDKAKSIKFCYQQFG